MHRYFSEHPEDIPTGGALCTTAPNGTVRGVPTPGGVGMTEEYMQARCTRVVKSFYTFPSHDSLVLSIPCVEPSREAKNAWAALVSGLPAGRVRRRPPQELPESQMWQVFLRCCSIIWRHTFQKTLTASPHIWVMNRMVR